LQRGFEVEEEKGMQVLTIRLPAETYERLKRHAEGHGVSISEVVRSVVEEHLAGGPAPAPQPPVPGPPPGEIQELRKAVELLALEQGELRRYVEGLGAEQEELKARLGSLGAADEEIKRYVGDLYGRTNQLQAALCELVRRLVPVVPFPVPGPFPVPPWMV
jgi:predicted RNase H-like nuclease (RuvC/YqgF family)